jgi:hypothetical protein
LALERQCITSGCGRATSEDDGRAVLHTFLATRGGRPSRPIGANALARHLEAGTKLAPAEKKFLENAARWYDRSVAYAHIQRTHPLTAAYSLNDSPAALAAWILEKFRDWSDCEGDLYRRFTLDELSTNITLIG